MVRPFAVIGFTVFVVLSLIFTNEKAAIILLILAIAAFIISMCFKRTRQEFLIPTVAMSTILAVVFSFAYCKEPKRNEELFDSKTVYIEARIIENETKNQNRYFNTVETVKIGKAKYKTKIRIITDKSLNAEPYDNIKAKLRLKSIFDGNRSSNNYFLSKRMYLKGTVDKYIKVESPQNKPLNFYILKMQKNISKTLKQNLPQRESSLSTALLIGDKTELDYKIREDFANIGIAHMTAVSGLHLSLWCFFGLKLLEKIGLKRKTPYIISAVFVLFFMAITGFTQSVLRAGIMMLVMILGKLISQKSDAINSLGFALTLICLINPFCVFSVGLQLSTLATIGLILGYKEFKMPYRENFKDRSKIRKCINKVYNYLLGIVMSTVFACVFTMPITVINFNRIPLFMLNANLLLSLPAVLCMISAGCLAAVSKIPFLSFLIPIFKFSAYNSSKFILKVSELLSDFKFSYIKTNDRIFFAFLYIACGILAASCIVKFIEPVFNFKIPVAICSVLIAIFCIVSFADEMQKVTITVCDVGNGSAVLIQNRRELAVAGCGGTSPHAAKTLKNEIVKSDSQNIKFLYIPRESQSESGCLKDVLSAKNTQFIVSGTKNKILLKEFPDLKYIVSSDSDINLWKNAVLKCYTSNDESYAVLKVNGRVVLINFLPSADISNQKADVIICREKIPEKVNLKDAKLVVISADYENGIYFQDKYKNSAATCSQGNIKIDIYKNGKIRAERVK